MATRLREQVVIIGSGAGGAVTAHELAASGLSVVVLEEGGRFELGDYGKSPPAAMQLLYRRRGMTPILGPVPIGFVEGCCVGGSTEINSGFWHRTPPEVLHHWKQHFAMEHVEPEDLAPHFEWAEQRLEVANWSRELPKSTKLMARGADLMGWSADIVPRAAARCENTNACAQGCPKGAKQGMSRNLIPQAEVRGARVIPNCTAKLLLIDGTKVTGVIAEIHLGEGRHELVRIDADHVFVCAGATQTPALLRRSGIKRNVGDTFLIHPMLKMAALFDEEVDAHSNVLPLVRVKEFLPDIALGGAFYSPGHLALMLSDNWRENAARMPDFRRMAAYYVGVKSSGRGRVRPSWLDEGGATLKYEIAEDDLLNLSVGFARLAGLLLTAGAREVYPCVRGLPAIRSMEEANRWLGEKLPARALSLTTVHAFSSCPIGGRPDRCAADQFGRVHGLANLFVNDASMLPDSPGVNPQGTIMALARRNAHHFTKVRT